MRKLGHASTLTIPHDVKKNPTRMMGDQLAERGDTRDFEDGEYESVGTIQEKKDGSGMESPDGMSEEDMKTGGKVGDRATDSPAGREYWRKKTKFAGS